MKVVSFEIGYSGPHRTETRDGPSAATATLHAALRVIVDLLTLEEVQQYGKAEGLRLSLQQQPCCQTWDHLTCRSCRPYRSRINEALDAWAEAGTLAQRLRWALLPQGDTGGTIDTPFDDE